MAWTLDTAIILTSAVAPDSLVADFYAHGAVTNYALGDVSTGADGAGTQAVSFTRKNAATSRIFKSAAISNGVNTAAKYHLLHVTDMADGFQGICVIRQTTSLTGTVLAALSVNPRENEWGTGARDALATNNDKTGYSLSQAFPTNFSALNIDGSGNLTLTATERTNIANVVGALLMTDLSATPAAAATLLQAMSWMYMMGRNQREQTATTHTLRKNDSTTAVATSTESDDGTVFTRGKFS